LTGNRKERAQKSNMKDLMLLHESICWKSQHTLSYFIDKARESLFLWNIFCRRLIFFFCSWLTYISAWRPASNLSDLRASSSNFCDPIS
jgi:hypothetical protein